MDVGSAGDGSIWRPCHVAWYHRHLMQVFYNLAIMRYALYTGESIFVGFFRTRPGTAFLDRLLSLHRRGRILALFGSQRGRRLCPQRSCIDSQPRKTTAWCERSAM
jgi:hypothetical protein